MAQITNKLTLKWRSSRSGLTETSIQTSDKKTSSGKEQQLHFHPNYYKFWYIELHNFIMMPKNPILFLQTCRYLETNINCLLEANLAIFGRCNEIRECSFSFLIGATFCL